MIVTKNRSEQDIIELIKQGFKLFGENKVQEAQLKYQSINSFEKCELHLIGPLQSNKVKNAMKISLIKGLWIIKFLLTME